MRLQINRGDVSEDELAQRREKAMADPNIQNILTDPVMRQAGLPRPTCHLSELTLVTCMPCPLFVIPVLRAWPLRVGRLWRSQLHGFTGACSGAAWLRRCCKTSRRTLRRRSAT